MTPTNKLIDRFFAWHKPRDTGDIVQWIQDNIYLSDKNTAFPGQVRFDNHPYLPEVLRQMDDPKNHTVILCFATQTGKTTALYLYLGARMKRDPVASLWVMPNTDLAQSFSETRLQPLIKDCPCLAELMPSNRHEMKNLQMQLSTMTLNLVGSNSPSNISSRPIGLAILDETDKFATATSKEASAYHLALERTKSFPNRKHIVSSTPTLEHNTIWKEFQKGNQQYFFFNCPHCQSEQKFEFENLKWDAMAQDNTTKRWNMKRVADTAHYECPHCKGKITDAMKTQALRKGKWKATNPDARDGVVSFHLNSFYASMIRFSEIAIYFLENKNYVSGVQNFFNSWLALPFTEQHERPADFQPNTGRSKLEKWESEAIRMMGVDVQLECFYYVCRAWDTAGNSVLIDEGKVRLFEDLEAKREELKVNPEYLFIDAGYNTQSVYSNAWKYGWTCTKGEDRQELYRHPSGARHIYAPVQHMRAYAVDGNAFVSLLLFSSQHTQDVLSWLIQGNGLSSWESASDVSNEYKKHMVSHIKKMTFNKQTGTEKYLWCKIGTHTPDHLWDCETILTVASCYGKLIQVQAVEEEPKEEEKA